MTKFSGLLSFNHAKKNFEKIAKTMATKGKKMKKMTKIVLPNISSNSHQTKILIILFKALAPKCRVTTHEGKFALYSPGNIAKALSLHSRLMSLIYDSDLEKSPLGQAKTVSLV